MGTLVNPTQVTFCKAQTGEVSLSFSVFLSLPLSLRVAILCLFLQVLQSLLLDCPCHMGLWPHTPLDVFVAERHSQSLKESTQLILSLVCMLRQQFLLFQLFVVSCMMDISTV